MKKAPEKLTRKKKKAPQKLTRNQQWVANSLRRRNELLAAGGHRLLVLLDKEHHELLRKVIAYRKRADPAMNMTEWVRRMIVADLKTQVRRKRPAARPADAGRSS